MKLWPSNALFALATPVVVSVAAALFASPANAETWRVNNVDHAVSVHMRQSPSNRSKVLAYIPVDTRGITGAKCKARWCEIEFRDVKGWVFKKYLTPDDGVAEAPAEATAAVVDAPAEEAPAVAEAAATEAVAEATPESTPPEAAEPQPATAASSAESAAPDEPATLRLVQSDGPPIPVYTFPSDKLPIAGHLPSDTAAVQTAGACVKNWCYVRSGSLVGWLPVSRLVSGQIAAAETTQAAASNTTVAVKAEAPAATPAQAPAEPATTATVETPAEPATAATVEAPAKPATAATVEAPAEPATTATVEAPAINQNEPTATQTALVSSAIPETAAATDTDNKLYALAGIANGAPLAIREKPDDAANMLGSIPAEARDVQGLHKCSGKWCLIRYQDTSGWVLRRHLADESIEASRSYQVSGVALWSTLDVLDQPSRGASVVGHIPAYATGIVPIGGCDKTWCHVRYLGVAGWVPAQYLAAVTR